MTSCVNVNGISDSVYGRGVPAKHLRSYLATHLYAGCGKPNVSPGRRGAGVPYFLSASAWRRTLARLKCLCITPASRQMRTMIPKRVTANLKRLRGDMLALPSLILSTAS